MNLLERAAATVSRHSMLAGGETVLVGLSGGPDSVCLLTLLHRLAPDLNIKLHASYVDHGLRPEETPEEIEFCRDLCGQMHVPFIVKKIDVAPYAEQRGLNKQDAARTLRYGALREAAREAGADRIALGHNLDDHIETFLMHILRGSGPRGLSGIPPVRDEIIRPLIETERREIEEFLESEGISYIIDSSNLRHDYLRNRLRATIMPALKELNPAIMDTISRTTDIIREEDRYLEAAVTKALMRMISRKSDTSIELFLAPLENLDRVLLRRLLRRAVKDTEGLRGISYTHIEDVMDLIKHGQAGDRLTLPRDVRVIKQYSTVLITNEPPKKLGTYVLEPGGEAVLKEAGLLIRASLSTEPCGTDRRTVVLDTGKLALPLTVRSRRKGDFFYPEGFGKKKKLQDYFVDNKVPRDERDTVPIVTSGGDIVWVAGMRADERFLPDGQAETYLVLELKRLRD